MRTVSIKGHKGETTPALRYGGRQSRRLFVSLRLLTLFGYAAQDPLGRSPIGSLHPWPTPRLYAPNFQLDRVSNKS